ncbi:hypothetical protein ACELLULO517_21640 [Acidisoma cellulosilytica]|uniref:Uncharacterized protein n=1 Tax=Acidisoma cellulosilyticum TaxID=2802395 RepID=A0A963Z573_9PROT|nr:hypothetical protein [Acidisoma cellulosilyticum]MCB8882864.1 hypothetical protein [Acidisoma cellulosilyticum]
MVFYRIWAAAGVISIGLIGSAFSHTTTKHYAAPHHSTTHHYVAPKKAWRPAKPYHGKPVTHPKSYHAPAHKSWKHYEPSHKTWHKTYHKPAPPPRMPGRTTDGRFMLPGGMESTCSGGTPPPCQ